MAPLWQEEKLAGPTASASCEAAFLGGTIIVILPSRMPKTKVALTLDATLVHRVDELVSKRRFQSRSQAVEAALAEKLERLTRTRLARKCAKLHPAEEQRLAAEGLAAAVETWPEY